MSGRTGILHPAAALRQASLGLAAMLLVRSPLSLAGRLLLKLVRWSRPGRRVRAEHANTSSAPLPGGPFSLARAGQMGDLLLWVPRRFDSYLIDDLTGGYGFSHTTVDTGEVDVPTGKPVMVEITVGQTVERKFQDEYGPRAYARVPLREAGVDVGQFTECVRSKLGEKYDSWDALTLGAIRDPAREVCSGLAADCLPDAAMRAIARVARLRLLPRHAVSLHSAPGARKVKAFVSPNGFAAFYGVPNGRKIRWPDTLISPSPMDSSMGRMAAAAGRRHGWKAAAGLLLAAGAALAYILSGKRGRVRQNRTNVS